MRICSVFLTLVIMSFAGAPPQAAAQAVHILGCVKPGVETGCLIITDRQTGKTYQINSANPRPDPARNLVVDLKGEIFPGVDFCMQGPILKEITWNYTRMQCAAAKR